MKDKTYSIVNSMIDITNDYNKDKVPSEQVYMTGTRLNQMVYLYNIKHMQYTCGCSAVEGFLLILVQE